MVLKWDVIGHTAQSLRTVRQDSQRWPQLLLPPKPSPAFGLTFFLWHVNTWLIIMVKLFQVLACAWQCPKHLTCIISFDPPHFTDEKTKRSYVIYYTNHTADGWWWVWILVCFSSTLLCHHLLVLLVSTLLQLQKHFKEDSISMSLRVFSPSKEAQTNLKVFCFYGSTQG